MVYLLRAGPYELAHALVTGNQHICSIGDSQSALLWLVHDGAKESPGACDDPLRLDFMHPI